MRDRTTFRRHLGRAVALFCAGLAMVIAGTAPAFDANAGGRGPRSPEQHVERLSESLSLSDVQEAQLLEIFEQAGEQMRALRDAERSGDLERSELREEHERLRAEADTRIAAVLDDAQLEEFETLRKEHRSRRHGKGGHRERGSDRDSLPDGV